ncbi:MAG TPA: hypothetical protein VEK08_22505 [Planctomycetota bacterium]|nr:hypothetical protein [Planctomycetota bacterium]
MPLTAAQSTQIFEILGIPQAGSGAVVGSVATLFGPQFETYDMLGIVTQINSRIVALSAEQITRITALLDRYSTITASSPLQIQASSGGARGVLADHPAEREAIRAALGNVLGVAVPSGGFVAEAQRQARGGGTVIR